MGCRLHLYQKSHDISRENRLTKYFKSDLLREWAALRQGQEQQEEEK